MRIGIDMGHTLRGSDYGVVGLRPESELTREVGKRVIDKLQSLGHKVINCTVDNASSVSDSLYQRSYKANSNNVDIFVSVHFNATPGGYGTEIYTYGGKQLPEATRIRNEFKSLGFRDRGTKDGSRLAVIRNTSAKAMLVECCFCDSSSDMQKYNPDKFANAIVKGLVGTLPNKPVKPQEVVKVKNIVVYHYPLDQRSAEYLADYLDCPTVWNNRSFDYSTVESIYAVGGNATNYVKFKPKTIISGNKSEDTLHAVSQFIKEGK